MSRPEQSVRPTADVVERIDRMPLLPSSIARMLELDPSSDGFFDEVVALGRQDPMFALRLVRLANSSLSAPARPVTELPQAVVRLGSKQCANLAVALALSRVFVPRESVQRALWLHSVEVATVARAIAAMTPAAPFTAEQAYLAGLLHDVGRFPMLECAPADLVRVEEVNWSSPEEMRRSEVAVLGYDHLHLGALVCRRWSLPSPLADSITLHHATDLPRGCAGPVAALVRTVQLADRTSMLLELHPEVLDAGVDELAALVERYCTVPAAGPALPAPAALARRLGEIRREAAAVCSGILELQEHRRSA